MLAALCLPARATGQESAAIRPIREAYQNLAYDSVIVKARRAVTEQRLSRTDLVAAWELLAYAYGALDSTRQAVDAFRELIRLDPDREPDVLRVAPRITSLYASALGQVAVLRRVRADSATVVVGREGFPIRFEATRPSRVVARVSGPGLDTLIDSLGVAGNGVITWSATDAGGRPVPDGRFRILLEAASGREEYQALLTVDVRRTAVDTLAHLTALEGYSPRPESEQPERNWGPLGVAMAYTALAAVATISLRNGDLSAGNATGVASVAAFTSVVGLAASLRRPERRPVEANVMYNRMLQELLARRNEEIARSNVERRSRTLLVIVPVRGAS